MYGERIKQIRELRGMSRKELADKLGITEMSVGRYENNQREPKYDMLTKIAKALDVSPANLMFDDEMAAKLKVHITAIAKHYSEHIYPLIEYVNKDRFQGRFNVRELFVERNEMGDLAGLIDDIVANRLLHVANKYK